MYKRGLLVANYYKYAVEIKSEDTMNLIPLGLFPSTVKETLILS